MHRTISRIAVASLISLATAATGATAASAAPAARATPFTISATDIVYGQPNLGGSRQAGNSITITNTSRRTVEAPLLSWPSSSLLRVNHSNLDECLAMSLSSTEVRCWAYPLGPGETLDITAEWSTVDRGPGATVPLTVQAAQEPFGEPVPRTAARTTIDVSFEPLTGTFDIVASGLRLASDGAGMWRGTVAVTVSNISDDTVQYPVVLFDIESEDTSNWDDCVSVIPRPQGGACLLAPLAAGETRELALEWASSYGQPGVDPTAQVFAASDAAGTLIPGTGVGYPVPVTLG